MHFDWHQLWVNISLPDNVPIVLMMVLTIIILMVFPQIAMWLPNAIQ